MNLTLACVGISMGWTTLKLRRPSRARKSRLNSSWTIRRSCTTTSWWLDGMIGLPQPLQSQILTHLISCRFISRTDSSPILASLIVWRESTLRAAAGALSEDEPLSSADEGELSRLERAQTSVPMSNSRSGWGLRWFSRSRSARELPQVTKDDSAIEVGPPAPSERPHLQPANSAPTTVPVSSPRAIATSKSAHQLRRKLPPQRSRAPVFQRHLKLLKLRNRNHVSNPSLKRLRLLLRSTGATRSIMSRLCGLVLTNWCIYTRLPSRVRNHLLIPAAESPQTQEGCKLDHFLALHYRDYNMYRSYLRLGRNRHDCHIRHRWHDYQVRSRMLNMLP